MIRIHIERAADRSIRSFSVNGHAKYADPGQDIVCAGVSAVTFGTLNAAEALLGVELATETAEDGRLSADIPDGLPATIREKLQLLLESMVVMLGSIEQSYGSYIRLKESVNEGGETTCSN